MMFGLKERDIVDIKAVLRQFPEVEEALIFGSRAIGNYKRGSDVDIAIKGRELTFRTTSRIAGILNEDTLMPYRFDVLGYNELKNKELLRHIDRIGQLLYQRDAAAVANEPSFGYKTEKK
ncbi:MAG TPA: nucleotidyltransferase domain-containing protein [Pricia sp.]|nr:nucleotidyltransferase domain-containing protein [Pricia sp.]